MYSMAISRSAYRLSHCPARKLSAFRVPLYGLDQWAKLFTDRQLVALGTFVRELHRSPASMEGVPDEWREAVISCVTCMLSKLTDYSSNVCSWDNTRETLRNTFARFALPIVWDYCEVNPLSNGSGGFSGMADWLGRYLDHALAATGTAPASAILNRSAIETGLDGFDLICTDPPYYDAIPYSDLMDFFYVWLRRVYSAVSCPMPTPCSPTRSDQNGMLTTAMES